MLVHRADDGPWSTCRTNDWSADEDNHHDLAGAEVEGAVYTEVGTFHCRQCQAAELTEAGDPLSVYRTTIGWLLLPSMAFLTKGRLCSMPSTSSTVHPLLCLPLSPEHSSFVAPSASPHALASDHVVHQRNRGEPWMGTSQNKPPMWHYDMRRWQKKSSHDKQVYRLIYASAPLGAANAYMFYRCCFFCFFSVRQKTSDNRSRERLNGFSWNFYQTMGGNVVCIAVPKWGLGHQFFFWGGLKTEKSQKI